MEMGGLDWKWGVGASPTGLLCGAALPEAFFPEKHDLREKYDFL